MTFDYDINVDEPITDMVVTATPFFVTSGTESTINVTMTSGTRMTLDWNFQDGGTDSQTIDNATLVTV